MPKSTTKDLEALREEVFARDGYRCIWPGCNPGYAYTFTHSLQLVHLEHRGMGGRKSVNVAENCITLCPFHHSIYDGRDGTSNTRREWAKVLAWVAGI